MLSTGSTHLMRCFHHVLRARRFSKFLRSVAGFHVHPTDDAVSIDQEPAFKHHALGTNIGLSLAGYRLVFVLLVQLRDGLRDRRRFSVFSGRIRQRRSKRLCVQIARPVVDVVGDLKPR